MNIISTDTVKQLQITPTELPTQYRLFMANDQVQQVTHAVHNFLFAIPALTPDGDKTALYFRLDFLVMDTAYNLVLGLPFTDFHQFIPHYCQNTYIYTSTTGHRLTIPLHHSDLTTKCSHKFCPFASKLPFPKELPTHPPFTPPPPHVHDAPSPPPIRLANLNAEVVTETKTDTIADHCFSFSFRRPIPRPYHLFPHVGKVARIIHLINHFSSTRSLTP